MVFTLATYALTCICRGHTGRGRHKCPNHAACLHGDRPDTCPSTARRPLPREASANVVKPLSRDVHSLTPRPRAGIYRALQRLPVHPTSTHQRKKQIKGIMRELTPLIVINTSSLLEREREREHGTGILFEEPNPTGSHPRGLIGLYKRWHQEERPQPAKRSNREEGGGDRGSTAAFIQEGNRAPVSKATHSRYRGGTPLTRK